MVSLSQLILLPVTHLEMPESPGIFEMKPPRRLSDEEFFEFCRSNPELRIEYSASGKLYIMSPVGLNTGFFENEVNRQLSNWAFDTGLGYTFSPSSAFKLNDGSTYCPDGAWVSKDKFENLTSEERKKIPLLTPDFIIEVRSESDSLSRLKQKMKKVWMANGVRLAWLIDPLNKKAYIYRRNKKVETVSGFEKKLFGEGVCPGLEFDLSLLTI